MFDSLEIASSGPGWNMQTGQTVQPGRASGMKAKALRMFLRKLCLRRSRVDVSAIQNEDEDA